MGSMKDWAQRQNDDTDRRTRPVRIEMMVSKWPTWPQVARPAGKRLGWSVGLAAAVLCLIWGIAAATAPPDGSPQCAGKAMRRGDVCESLKGEVVVDTRSYDQMTGTFEKHPVAWGFTLVVLVFALLVIVPVISERVRGRTPTPAEAAEFVSRYHSARDELAAGVARAPHDPEAAKCLAALDAGAAAVARRNRFQIVGRAAVVEI